MATGSVVFSPAYELDLGAHVWPTEKYRLIVEQALAAGLIAPGDVVAPEPCPWQDLALVHGMDYLEKVRTFSLSPAEIATLELPLTPEIVDGFRLMTGGTCRAAVVALERGVGIHLGGGLHHAFANHGEGFCLFNDVAVAIRTLQRDGRISGAAIVDCDVHHGNGTAMIFDGDPTVFTLSLHQQHNYPLFKPRSDLDVGLEDGTTDDEYVARLEPALGRALAHWPDILFHLAGADPFVHDRLGGLALTKEGLRRRDRMVLSAAKRAGVPVVVVLAGGYAVDVRDTVAIHLATVAEALSWRPGVSRA